MQGRYLNPRSIVLVHGGREVCSISGAYDLSNVPVEYLGSARSACAHTLRLVVNVPVTEAEVKEHALTVEQLMRWRRRPWWRKFLGLGPSKRLGGWTR